MGKEFMGIFSIGQTLDRGFRLYRLGVKKYFLILVLPSLFSAIFLFNPPQIAAAGIKHFPLSYWIALIISLPFGIWASIVGTRFLYSLSQGRNMEIREILRLSTPKDFLYIVSFIIWGVAVLLSFVLLIIPGIYFLNLIFLGAISCTIERKYFFTGIKRIWVLTKGRWWKTCIITSISYLAFLVPMILGMVLMGVTAIAGVKQTGTGEGFSFLSFLSYLIYMLMVSILGPLFTSIMVIHYNSLRCEKENADLMSELDALGTAEK